MFDVIHAHQLPLKTKAAIAATDTNCTAAVTAEHCTAFVSFQWQQANHTPVKNVISVASPVLPAGQFSGDYANYAKNVVTTATFVTF